MKQLSSGWITDHERVTSRVHYLQEAATRPPTCPIGWQIRAERASTPTLLSSCRRCRRRAVRAPPERARRPSKREQIQGLPEPLVEPVRRDGLAEACLRIGAVDLPLACAVDRSSAPEETGKQRDVKSTLWGCARYREHACRRPKRHTDLRRACLWQSDSRGTQRPHC
eukprot:scaffold4358_cov70-Phaeocystis_antarctica.AAC.1